MKIKVFFLLLAAGAAGLVKAQSDNGDRYGITANFHQHSTVGIHDVSKGRFGGGLGIFAEYPLRNSDVSNEFWYYIQPQIEYSMQGEIAKAEEATMGKQKFLQDYVTAAVYFKYFFHQDNIKRPYYLFIGPRAEFLVSKKKETSTRYENTYYKYNIDNKVNNFGIGGSVGAGYQIDDNFEAFIRYDHGFTKVYPDAPRNNYNHLLGIGVNYFINFNN